MAMKDMFAKARAAATKTVSQHRSKIDQGITKIGEVANIKTGGRYRDQIAQGSERARTGLDKIRSEPSDTDRPHTDRPDTDGPAPTTPVSR